MKIEKVLSIILSLIKKLSLFIVGYLFFLSLFGTSLVGKEKIITESGTVELCDKRFFLPDNVLLNLFFVVGLFTIFLVLRKKIGKFVKVIAEKRFVLYFFYFIVGIIYILTSHMYPNSDPGKVLNVAYSIISGDISSYVNFDGYMYRYPFQNGVVLLNVALIKLFKSEAFIAYQVINLIAQIFFVEYLWKISQKMWEKVDNTSGGILLFLLLLFPVSFLFITYNYGNGISLALITVAIYTSLVFFEKRDFRLTIVAAVIAGLACVVKSNSRIIVIAIIIALLFDCIKSKRILNNISFICLLLVFRLLIAGAVDLTIEKMTGVTTPEGMPNINWVAMGISDPGTYNGLSVDLFRDADFDTEKSKKLAAESIRKRIKSMCDDKSEAVKWFGRKMALNWNDPTFDALNVNKGRETLYFNDFYKELFDGKYSRWLETYLNVFNILVLFGVLICLCLEKNFTYKSSIMALCLIGGFVFHIFWEGSSHYTLPYFLLLFPYAARGLKIAMRIVSEKSKECKIFIIIFFVGMTLFAGRCFRIVEYTIFVSDTVEELSEYYENTP